MTRKEILDYALSFLGTYQDSPFHDSNWQLVRYRKNKKAFVWTYEWHKPLNYGGVSMYSSTKNEYKSIYDAIMEGQLCINLKVDPEWHDVLINSFESVIPAYHMNKTHWVTIIVNDAIPHDELKRLIAESYDLVAKGKKDKCCG